jgi:hypothetical protein
MAQWTRRQVIGTTLGVASAAAAAFVWNLHQHLPARDPAAEDRFRRAQDVLLAGNGNSVLTSAGVGRRAGRTRPVYPWR